MDLAVIKKMEVLLEAPEGATVEEIDYRITELHQMLDKIKYSLAEMPLVDKAAMLSVLSRANELIHKAMEMKLKKMGLSFDKFHDVMGKAIKSKEPKFDILKSAMQYVEAQSHQLSATLAKADVRLSKNAGVIKGSATKKLKRQQWKKS